MTDFAAEQENVVRYLLGNITDEERDRIGEKSFVNLEFGEFIEAVEDDLIELYIRNRLDTEQRNLFERNFLVTRERQEKVLALSAILAGGIRQREERSFADEHDSRERSRTSWRFWPRSFATRPVLAACAVLVCVLAIVAEFLLVRDWWRKRDAPLIAMGDLRPMLAVQTARSGTTSNELKVRPDFRSVAILLAAPDGPSKYIVELHAGARTVWRQENAVPTALDGEPVLVVSIPTMLLREGEEYTVAWQRADTISDAEPHQARYRVKYQQ